MPRIPTVEVYAPRALFAGRPATIEVAITADQPTKVDYVDVRITGHEGWRIGSGKNATSMRARSPELIARLRDKDTLPAGTTRVRTSFSLPANIPPSHRMDPAWAWLELYVRVAIKWWPDGKYRFTLPVRVPPPDVVERKPYAVRSSGGNEPRIELSLASTRLVAGETVVGSLAVFHLDDKKPREIDVTLVPGFRLLRGGRYRERRGDTLGFTVTVPAGAAGTSIPFRFRLPAEITPSFAASTHELSWWMLAKTGSFFGPKVEVGTRLEIFDASASARTERLRAAPRLTDERIAGAFAQLARDHGWNAAEDSDDPDQLVTERSFGDAMLRIGYAYRGEAGAFLIARVSYPSLGLDLSVTSSSRVRELLSKDIEIDLAEWDRAHHVIARSESQAQAFLRLAVPAVLHAMTWVGRVVRWSDDEIVFEEPAATITITELARTAKVLEDLARELEAVAVPPPVGLDVDLHGWKQLSQRLHGHCSPGDLSIVGTIDQRPALVELEFEGETPVRVRCRVGDPQTAVDGEPLTDAERNELTFDHSDLELVDGVASAALSISGRLEPAHVRELLTALRALLARRDPNRGPYR
jgi:hypothetical protein